MSIRNGWYRNAGSFMTVTAVISPGIVTRGEFAKMLVNASSYIKQWGKHKNGNSEY